MTGRTGATIPMALALKLLKQSLGLEDFCEVSKNNSYCLFAGLITWASLDLHQTLWTHSMMLTDLTYSELPKRRGHARVFPKT